MSSTESTSSTEGDPRQAASQAKPAEDREMTEKRNPHSVRTVKCSVCGKVRQEVNHWFVVRTVCFFVCWPFSESEEAELEQDERPVCGQGCAQKEFECWMTEKRNAPSETPSDSAGSYHNFEL